MLDLKILILGNMANDGYSVAKEMRKMGIEVKLAVNVSDFGMALPEWEDADLTDIDPYDFAPNEALQRWTPPDWIIYFDWLNKVRTIKAPIAKIRSRLNLVVMPREYDIVETHVPYSIFVQFSGVPYCPYDAGAIRYFPFQNTFRAALFRKSYANARLIIFTNPDTLNIFSCLDYIEHDKLRFVPFAVDPDKYRPIDATSLKLKFVRDPEDILLFSPSRQIWKEKGNEKIIVAFAGFAKEHPRARLVMVDWSVDNARSQELVNRLGIQQHVVWIKPVPKKTLIRYYNAADIVLDQFVLGSWGTSTPEAMACGKPVLIYYNPDHITRCFGGTPPMPNSYSAEDIRRNLEELARDACLRNRLGRECREWVMRTHHPRLVAQKHYDILKQVAQA